MRAWVLVLGALSLAGVHAGGLAAQQQQPQAPQQRPAKRPRVGLRLLRPGEEPTAAGVTTQSAVRPAATGSFTAGLSMTNYDGHSDGERDAYVARFTQLLDSAVVTLVDVFRNTSGQPIVGAENPASLSQRERDRWTRCRDLHFDIPPYAGAFQDLERHLPQTPAMSRAATQLDSALAAIQATSECDNLASMIAAPGRWTPWGEQYSAAAQRFYRDWYTQLREADDRNRAFVLVFNGGRAPGARIPVPPALPRTPPYAGAGPRD